MKWTGKNKKGQREKYAPEKNKGKEGGEKIDSNKKRVGKYYENRMFLWTGSFDKGSSRNKCPFTRDVKVM